MLRQARHERLNLSAKDLFVLPSPKALYAFGPLQQEFPKIMTNIYHRPAWIEIDLRQLANNFDIINRDKTDSLALLSVVKDQAYGHGAYQCAKIALEKGIKMLGVVTISEAVELREKDITAPILLMGERLEDQFEFCLAHKLTMCINSPQQAQLYAQYARKFEAVPDIHVEVDTGMGRYGVRWTEAADTVIRIMDTPGIYVQGIMTHFARSDELDKSYANEQLRRFQTVLTVLSEKGISFPLVHACNTGGFLDLPHAHFDMVRTGILPLGVYPSQVCRRLEGIQPIMSVKAKIVAMQRLQKGDKVGYGMHYTAPSSRAIGVIPLGYGDGFPRVRNQGDVLLQGKRAPIVGGNAMDAMMVDVTDIPQTQIGDEIIVMGSMGNETISARDLATLKGTVSYEVLTNWSWRLPRVYL